MEKVILDIFWIVLLNFAYTVGRTIDISFISNGKASVAQFVSNTINSIIWIWSAGLAVQGVRGGEMEWLYAISFGLSTGFATSVGIILSNKLVKGKDK